MFMRAASDKTLVINGNERRAIELKHADGKMHAWKSLYLVSDRFRIGNVSKLVYASIKIP